MTAHTLVQDPTTGELVEYGSLSTADQQQWQADNAASDAFFNSVATTGSYTNVPAAAVNGPISENGGSYNTSTGYVATDSSGTPADTTATNSYTEAPAPDFSVIGGYDPNAIGSTGGGYDPDNPSYGNEANSIGGAPAVSQDNTGAPSFAGGYYGDQTESSGGGYDPSVQGLTDPTNQRLAAAGINAGGSASAPAASPSVSYQTQTSNGTTAMASDWRIRISLADKATIFYNDPSGSNSLMMPLKKTNGVIFPYTPSITVTHAASYSGTNPTHSNYPQQFYQNSEVSDITISGDFTVQSIDEGQYLMAAIYFFRSSTKMFFGSGTNVGNPPPVVFLDGYGDHYFPHVPCVISSFSHTLSPDVDYIEIPITSTLLSTSSISASGTSSSGSTVATSPFGTTAYAGQVAPNFATNTSGSTSTPSGTTATQITSKTRVPTSSTISITLKPVYSRKNLHDRFDLNKFAAGQLLQDKTNGYGGFL